MADLQGPASDQIDLPLFAQQVSTQADRYLPDPAGVGRFRQYTEEQRGLLANRLDCSDLRSIGDRIYRRPQKVIELDIWQKARYLAGSDDAAALAAMQEKILGSTKSSITPAPLKGGKKANKGKRIAANGNADDAIDPSLQLDEDQDIDHAETPVEALKRARTVSSRTPLPTPENAIKPADGVPVGLEIYEYTPTSNVSCLPLKEFRPFPEAQHYIRWVKKSDLNTLLGTRYHARGHAAEMGLTNEQVSMGCVSNNDPGPPKADPLLVLSFTFHPLNSAQRTARHEKVVLLSSQSLADLRDVLLCPSDAIPTELPAEVHHTGRYQRFGKSPAIRGAAILIENTVYSDTRAGRSDLAQLLRHQLSQPDYEGSLAVRNAFNGVAMDGYAAESKAGEPHYEYSDIGMQHIQLGSLRLRLRQPYWLVHQGNCEHIITLEAVRLKHPHDQVPLAGPQCPYPLITMASRLGADKCRICNRDPATRTLVDDELTGDTPTLACDMCFHHLHGTGGELSVDPMERARQQAVAETMARERGVDVVPILETMLLR